MNASLNEEWEGFVRQKVESGLYRSAGEVISDGLRLLKERDDLLQEKISELREAIAIGIDQADAGRSRPFDEETTARIKARGRMRLESSSRPDPT